MLFNDDLKTVEMLKTHISETGITQKQLARELNIFRYSFIFISCQQLYR